jgi:glucose-6-phosphate 1-epimerase
MTSPHNPASIEEIQIGDLPCWRLRTEWAEALITRQGAQLLSYQPHGQPPVVWLSEQAEYKQGQALRGGVPVCWPWFSDLERNPEAVRAMVATVAGAPAHGRVRAMDWDLGAATCEAGTVVIDFHIDLPNGAGPWPHPAELMLRCRLGKSLELELSTHNFGDAPITVSQALHTYFAVSDSRQVVVTGLEDTRYVETLENWEERTQQGPIRITGETDRIYLGLTQPVVITDPGCKRASHVKASNSNSAVVWNPWVDKAARLSQFADDAWQRMLCVETARVWDDLLVVAPGKTETMAVEIWSELQG